MDWTEFIALVPSPATVTVEAYQGDGAHGPVYAAAVNVERCVVEHRRRQVTVQTQDTAGRVHISSTTVRCPPGTVAPVDSLVTVPGGQPARVLQRVDWDDHGLGLPSHVELLLE